MPVFFDDSEQRTIFYKQLQDREKKWWEARQRLIVLKERQLFWFGDSSLMMWLLWQLVAYVVMAIILMLISRLLNIYLSLWQYSLAFAVQTVVFIIMLAAKGRLANRLYNDIENAELEREQALNEMIILATDSIFPDIYKQTPISLQHIHDRYGTKLRLASLQCLLQKEVDAGRLLLAHQTESKSLPPEFADDELVSNATQIIYKSAIPSY